MALKHLITCIVAGIDYLVHPKILGSVEESVREDQVIPVVVLSEEEVNGGPEQLGRTLQYLVDNDDICTDEFTGIIVVKPSGPGSDPLPALATAPDASLGRSFTVYHLATRPETSQEKDLLPSGPYFLSGRNLHQAWRLYPDDLNAFTFGLLPDSPFDSQSFQAVASLSSDGLSKTIPVPSRLYHKADSTKPLAGKRVSLKDTFDIQGAKTTLSSRAWAELYPAANNTAAYVKKLIDLGAVVVGKTKTTQFATGAEWVDSHSPVNPRGDQYHDSSGSSAGAAASVSGYGWLDFSVGVDSDGGVRGPATCHGVHSIRPTFGTASLQGLSVSSLRFDAVGLFGRTLEDLLHIVKHSFDVPGGSIALPRRIIYPTDYFPLPEPEEQQLAEQFVQVLEAHLDVKRTEVSFAKLWEDHSPSDSSAAGESLQQYLQKAPFWSLCYDFHKMFSHFKPDYRRHFGRDPYVEPSPRFRWSVGANITDHEYDEYLARLDTFRTWFDRVVMSLSSGSDDTVMILPSDIAGREYQDEPPDEPITLEGIGPRLLSPVLGTPQVVVPFAQLPYVSRITARTEYKPFSVSLMGARGSDLALLRLVKEATRAAGWRTNVDTGRLAFPVGKNSRHVRDHGANYRNEKMIVQQHVDGDTDAGKIYLDEL